jgi:hypothetical protein
MKEIAPNYLWTHQVDNIDNEKLYQTCLSIENRLKKEFPPINNFNQYGSFAAYYHRKYNLLTFSCTELHKLYSNIVTKLSIHLDQNTNYYIRCWANLFDIKQNINWHSHWASECKAYHGFYCVNTEGEHMSYTDYRVPGIQHEIRVASKDGLLVFGKSDGDRHRSSPWLNTDKFRVTIAFDIAPIDSLVTGTNYDDYLLNNYIPLLKV